MKMILTLMIYINWHNIWILAYKYNVYMVSILYRSRDADQALKALNNAEKTTQNTMQKLLNSQMIVT